MQLNGFNHVPLQLSERIIEHPEDATHAIVIIEGENGKKKPYAAWRAMKYTCSNEEDIRNLPTESNQFAQDNDFNKNTLTIFQNYLLDQINKNVNDNGEIKPVCVISMEDAAFFDNKILQQPLYRQFMRFGVYETFKALGLASDGDPTLQYVVTTTQAERAPINFTNHLGKDFEQASELGGLTYPYYRAVDEKNTPVNVSGIMKQVSDDYGSEGAMDRNILQTYVTESDFKLAGRFNLMVWDDEDTRKVLKTLKTRPVHE